MLDERFSPAEACDAMRIPHCGYSLYGPLFIVAQLVVPLLLYCAYARVIVAYMCRAGAIGYVRIHVAWSDRTAQFHTVQDHG